MTCTTGWRINDGPMTADDCHRDHISRLWVDGTNSDDARRRGVSCCDSLEALADYFAAGTLGVRTGRSACFAGAYLVCIEGVESEDEPWDKGEALLHPTAVLFSRPVEETELLPLLCDHLQMRCGRDERIIYDAERGEMMCETRCSVCGGTGEDEDNDDGLCWECDGAGWTRRD